jgi:hypothetical protein
MIDLHFQGRLGHDLQGRDLQKHGGFACQEQVGLGEFLDNRFGRVYGKGSRERPLPEFSGSVS